MTAVEWLIDKHFGGIENCTPDFKKHIEQAIEMEKKQQDELAIGFSDWMICKAEKYNSYLCLIKDYKELLKIYKNETKR
jgi:hypothetical protein